VKGVGGVRRSMLLALLPLAVIEEEGVKAIEARPCSNRPAAVAKGQSVGTELLAAPAGQPAPSHKRIMRMITQHTATVSRSAP
jgi:hypothetical protein